jgi:Cu(I)/Ag(I) efflux system membrane fusion protein
MKSSLTLHSCALALALFTRAFAQHAHEGLDTASKPAAGPGPTIAQGLSAEALKTLGVSMSKAGAALASDDLAGYKALQGSVRGAYHDLADIDSPLAAQLATDLVDPLPARADIKEARKDYVRFSTAVADALRERKLVRAANLRVFECRMAPEIGTGRWLQAESVAKNPFFGSSMLKCGTELDRVARALPAGHPPIGHLTAAEKAQYTAPAKKASDGGCGSCGMSKEAMAAGEPCEHDKK